MIAKPLPRVWDAIGTARPGRPIDVARIMNASAFHARPFGRILAAFVLALLARPACAADASEYLFLPSVVQDEREIDLHLGVGSSGARTRHRENSGFGLGIGVTQRWFTEVAVAYHREMGAGTKLDAFEWENVVQLAEPGEWPVDVGLALNVEQPHNAAEGPSLRAGPLLQKEFGRFQANVNVLYSRHFRTANFQTAQLHYQGQIKYRYSQPFEFGAQAFGTMGNTLQTWSPYSEQVHRLGPVVLGRLVIPGEKSLSYNLAYLVGTTARSPDRTLRLQVEYEF